MQLRDKTSDTRPMIEAARAIKAALAPLGVPFVVNDRVDVALAARADGVHIGPDDMAPEDARALARPGRHHRRLDQERRGGRSRAASICSTMRASAASMRRSRRQQENPPIGPEGLARIAAVLRRRAPNVPVVGIAGIDAGNAAAVIAAGADGVAVISALSLAPDPAAAARALREVVDGMLAKRGT